MGDFIDWIYVIYGLAFFSLGVVAWVLPRNDKTPAFSNPMGWLAAFGVIHGLLGLVDGMRAHHGDTLGLAASRSVLLTASFFALLEFARRLAPRGGNAGLARAGVVHAVAAAGVLLVVLWTGDVIYGLDAGVRYVVGAPAGLATGLMLLRDSNTLPFADRATAGYRRWIGGAFVAFAGLTLLVPADVPRLQWLPSGAESVAAFGVPAQALRTIAAVVIAAGMVLAIREAGGTAAGALVPERERLVRAERKLPQQRDFATSLLSLAPVVILLLDRDGRIRHVNPYFENLTGYSLEEVKGKDWFSTFLPERDRAGIRELFDTAIGTERTRGNVNAIVTRDGEEREIEWHDEVLRDADGRVKGLLAAGQDVTARVKAVRALEQSEARLREGQRIAKIGSWELDLTTDELHWSDEIYRMFEIDKACFGASYEAFLDAIHPEDRNAVDEAYTLSLENRTRYEITHRLLMPDGRIKYVREACETEFADDGTPLLSRGTVQDITELHLAEEELRNSETKYRSLIEGANDMIFRMTVPEGEFEYVSPSAEHVIGHRAEDLYAQPPHAARVIHPDSRDYFDRQWAKLLDGCVEPHYEYQIIDSAGNTRWITQSNSGVYDGSGRLIAVEGICRDETERRKVQEEVERYRDHLEEIVAQRTADLTAARNEAERANAAKSEFLSRMSHELRTPLNAIIGFGQLLGTDAREPLTPAQHDSVHEILVAGRHLLALVNEVLDLSQVERGALAVSLEPVGLRPLVDDCFAQLQPLAQARQVSLSCLADDGLAAVADRMRLKQVLLNLLSNAIKYNRAGGTVRVRSLHTGESTLRIEVQDDGHGIAADDLPDLFQPFKRLESAHSGIEGTGIGLTLARQLVEAMRGEIGVDSTVGVGSTFWVQLPLHTAQAAGRARRKLVYVEDNPADLRQMQRLVACRDGLTLFVAEEAEEGLGIIAAERPDLVLLDLTLAARSGHDALEQLQRATRDTPVIAVRSAAMRGAIECSRRGGYAECLVKPLDAETFHRAVDRHLGLGQSEQDAD